MLLKNASRKSSITAWALAAFGLLAITQIVVAEDYPAIGEGFCPEAYCRKICRSTMETKTVSTRVYDSVCEDFCLPKCSLFGYFFGHKACCGDGDGGACAICERPRTKRYLVVKIRNHEECVNKCIVEHEVCPVTPPRLHSAVGAPVGQAGPSPLPELISK